mmetsp:Transcript_20199/g.71423  ORF Transcript_20199/g.71423 Transcript_20199/m.71423 type:complete len:251 (+) Transcript_20199:3-755(+)
MNCRVSGPSVVARSMSCCIAIVRVGSSMNTSNSSRMWKGDSAIVWMANIRLSVVNDFSPPDSVAVACVPAYSSLPAPRVDTSTATRSLSSPFLSSTSMPPAWSFLSRLRLNQCFSCLAAVFFIFLSRRRRRATSSRASDSVLLAICSSLFPSACCVTAILNRIFTSSRSPSRCRCCSSMSLSVLNVSRSIFLRDGRSSGISAESSPHSFCATFVASLAAFLSVANSDSTTFASISTRVSRSLNLPTRLSA